MSVETMSEAEALFAALRQSADGPSVAAIERLVREAPDRELCRVNALAFAQHNNLDPEQVIAAFLHAARVGLFELSWNVLCPGCGGVLGANTSLKTVHAEAYSCAVCAANYEPNLDEMVEVTFTVSPRIRRIPAHHPELLSFFDYCAQLFLAQASSRSINRRWRKLRSKPSSCHRVRRRWCRSRCLHSSLLSSSQLRTLRISST